MTHLPRLVASIWRHSVNRWVKLGKQFAAARSASPSAAGERGRHRELGGELPPTRVGWLAGGAPLAVCGTDAKRSCRKRLDSTVLTGTANQSSVVHPTVCRRLPRRRMPDGIGS